MGGAQLLHAGALVLALGGACCVAVDRRRRRIRETAAAIVSVAAMADVGLGLGAVPVVWWAVLVIAAAVVVAVGPRSAAGHERAMRATDAVGAILMAALMLAMSAAPGAHAVSHHGAAPLLAPLLVAGVLAHTAATVTLAVRTPGGVLARVPLVAMNGSVVLLAVALVA